MSLPTKAEVSVEIAASPEAVYALVADVTRMGEWSPECTSCEWLDEPGAVGSRFRGRNRSGVARWSTRLTESFEAVTTPTLIGLAERLFIRNRQQQLEAGMAATLGAIKAVAERDA